MCVRMRNCFGRHCLMESKHFSLPQPDDCNEFLLFDARTFWSMNRVLHLFRYKNMQISRRYIENVMHSCVYYSFCFCLCLLTKKTQTAQAEIIFYFFMQWNDLPNIFYLHVANTLASRKLILRFVAALRVTDFRCFVFYLLPIWIWIKKNPNIASSKETRANQKGNRKGFFMNRNACRSSVNWISYCDK